jgi:hypothetical protein
MKASIRILFACAALALFAGFLGLRAGNASLEARIERPGAEASR